MTILYNRKTGARKILLFVCGALYPSLKIVKSKPNISTFITFYATVYARKQKLPLLILKRFVYTISIPAKIYLHSFEQFLIVAKLFLLKTASSEYTKTHRTTKTFSVACKAFTEKKRTGRKVTKHPRGSENQT